MVGGRVSSGDLARLRATSAGVLAAGALASRLLEHLGSAAKSLLFAHEDGGSFEQHFRTSALQKATYELQVLEPQFSASQVVTRRQGICFVGLAVTLLSLIIASPAICAFVLTGIIAAGYLANAIFRGCLFWVGAAEPAAAMDEGQPEAGDLPSYTILIPLYREANVLHHLAASLRAIDYPGIMYHSHLTSRRPPFGHGHGFGAAACVRFRSDRRGSQLR